MRHEQPRGPSARKIGLGGGLGDEPPLGFAFGLEQAKDLLHAEVSFSPHERTRSGWMRISGCGSMTTSARPRTSIPRGFHGGTTSSMTSAARPVLATSRNFLELAMS